MKNQPSIKQLISDDDLEELFIKACRKTVWSLKSVCIPPVDRLKRGFKSPIIPAEKHWINFIAQGVIFERLFTNIRPYQDSFHRNTDNVSATESR